MTKISLFILLGLDVLMLWTAGLCSRKFFMPFVLILMLVFPLSRFDNPKIKVGFWRILSAIAFITVVYFYPFERIMWLIGGICVWHCYYLGWSFMTRDASYAKEGDILMISGFGVVCFAWFAAMPGWSGIICVSSAFLILPLCCFIGQGAIAEGRKQSFAAVMIWGLILALGFLASFGISDQVVKIESLFKTQKESTHLKSKNKKPQPKPLEVLAGSAAMVDLGPPQITGNRVSAYLEVDEDRENAGSKHFYLRQNAYVNFDGKRWHRAKNNPREVRDDYDGLADGWVLTGRKSKSKRKVAHNVYLVDHPFPHAPHLPGALAFAVDCLRQGAEESYTLDLRKSVMRAYTAISSPIEFLDIESENVFFKASSEFYTHLPNAPLMAFIKRHAREACLGAKNDYEKALRLKAWLNDNYNYTGKPLAPPAGKTSLEWFLMHEKKGHCVLHATAFTLLLRAAGIPSRLVTGYFACNYDPYANVYIFYNRNRHCWTEVNLRDFGWTTIDATPPDPEEGEPSIVKSNFLDVQPDFTFLGDPASRSAWPEQVKSSSLLVRLERVSPNRFFVFFAFLFAIVSVLFIFIRTLKSSRRITPHLKSKQVYEPHFYKLFRAKFAKLGYPGRKGQTGHEYLDFLKSKGVIGNEFDEMIDYYYQTRYEGKKSSGKKEKEFLGKLRKKDSLNV